MWNIANNPLFTGVFGVYENNTFHDYDYKSNNSTGKPRWRNELKAMYMTDWISVKKYAKRVQEDESVIRNRYVINAGKKNS